MSSFDTFAYVYLAIGCGIALISLSANWNESRRLSPVLFVCAHALWPIALGAILIYAFIHSRR